MKKQKTAILDLYDYEKLLPFINDPEYCGRMTAPDAAARLKGPCGDEMEFYLVIEDGILKEVKYYSEGCEFTRVCAAMTAREARGKTVEDALFLSAGQIKSRLKGLPPDHLHCSILAVTTLYRALVAHLMGYDGGLL